MRIVVDRWWELNDQINIAFSKTSVRQKSHVGFRGRKSTREGVNETGDLKVVMDVFYVRHYFCDGNDVERLTQEGQ